MIRQLALRAFNKEDKPTVRRDEAALFVVDKRLLAQWAEKGVYPIVCACAGHPAEVEARKKLFEDESTYLVSYWPALKSNVHTKKATRRRGTKAQI